MQEIRLREEETFIRLGQALKKSGLSASGADAKDIILQGQVTVNDKTELRRGRKLYAGDIVRLNGEAFQIAP